MTRRAFFARASVAAAALAVDPERLLWIPGAKTISIPAPRARWSILRDPELLRYQRQYNARLAAQMEQIRNSPLTIIGPYSTVSYQWTDADFPNS